jgi:hypothetical protein
VAGCSARQLRRFVSIHDPIANLFRFPATPFHPLTIMIFAVQPWQRGTKLRRSLLAEISSVGPTAFSCQQPYGALDLSDPLVRDHHVRETCCR